MTVTDHKTYKLTDPNGKSYEGATKRILGGHRKDKIYGTPDCKAAPRWIAKRFLDETARVFRRFILILLRMFAENIRNGKQIKLAKIRKQAAKYIFAKSRRLKSQKYR